MIARLCCHLGTTGHPALLLAMCHLAILHYTCSHHNVFQLHCANDQNAGMLYARDQLCERGQVEILARYCARLQCPDCNEHEWNDLADDRLAQTDDRLATLARLSAAGAVSRADHAGFAHAIAARDGRLEAQARGAQAVLRAAGGFVRRFVRAHAMVLWWADVGVYLMGKVERRGLRAVRRLMGGRALVLDGDGDDDEDEGEDEDEDGNGDGNADGNADGDGYGADDGMDCGAEDDDTICDDDSDKTEDAEEDEVDEVAVDDGPEIGSENGLNGALDDTPGGMDVLKLSLRSAAARTAYGRAVCSLRVK
ncbi:hypothetical protein BT67DRAFT_432157 [Trichocladium antarcticum]|uniref:Uncharacterized protein n=1 Tax=Trichocladium antarcticum TaxID=1450529 RepID=A0AAN6URS4_9PEZI|nr:hypothetical protein BT67DRAFT_432157 [Trichocladium antarcticum]